MPDLQAAREAAERTWMLADAIKAFWGERCPESDPNCACCQAWAEFDRLTGIASRPADYVGELVVPDEWVKDEIGGEYWRWSTTFGDYDICLDGMTWHYSVFGGMNLRCDSLEHGKALCRADFLGRIAGVLRGAKS